MRQTVSSLVRQWWAGDHRICCWHTPFGPRGPVHQQDGPGMSNAPQTAGVERSAEHGAATVSAPPTRYSAMSGRRRRRAQSVVLCWPTTVCDAALYRALSDGKVWRYCCGDRAPIRHMATRNWGIGAHARLALVRSGHVGGARARLKMKQCQGRGEHDQHAVVDAAVTIYLFCGSSNNDDHLRLP
jgi:hypothetical protein